MEVKETNHFDLVHEAWVPVLDMAGRQRLASLAECFQAGGEIRDLAVRPQERVALMRLLLCVAHAALDGPQDHRQRAEARKLLPEAAPAYLEKWKERFDLFHPQTPFLQIAGLRGAGKDESALASFAKLDFARASGNNAMLFDHGRSGEPTPAWLALNLVTFQMFSPGGLTSQVYWGGQVTEKTACDAPCICASMLHAFLRGANLLETVILNLPPRQLARRRYEEDGVDWWGRPVWEMFPRSAADKEAVRNATRTYVGRLVPLSRAIRLRKDGILLGEGLQYPAFGKKENPFTQEPSATRVLIPARKAGKKDEEKLLSCRPGRSVWRDLAAILVHQEKTGNAVPPLAITMLRPQDVCDLVAVGFPRDQANILDAVESVYSLNPELLEERGRNFYERGVMVADRAASALGKAMEIYRSHLDEDWEASLKRAGKDKEKRRFLLRNKGQLNFWTSVEADLGLLFQMVETMSSELAKKWCVRLARHAHKAYELACGQMSVRHLEAYTRGARYLPGGAWLEKMLL